MLHPVLQHVSRRDFVIPIWPQSKFAGVGNAVGIASVAANQRVIEHRGEIRRVLVAHANGDGMLARFVKDIQDTAVRSGVVRTDQIPDARDNCRPTLQRYRGCSNGHMLLPSGDFMAVISRWNHVDRKWRKVLDRKRIEVFHMTDSRASAISSSIAAAQSAKSRKRRKASRKPLRG